MFYIPTILRKKGPLAKLWLAAHDGSKLTKNQIMEINVSEALELFLSDSTLHESLRIQGDLLLGISYITKRQADYMMEMANHTICRISSLLPFANLEKEKHRKMGTGNKAGIRETGIAGVSTKYFFDFDEIQPNFDEIWMKDNLESGDLNNNVPKLTAEELDRRRKNVTMEEYIPYAQLDNWDANWIDDMARPIDQEDDDQAGHREANSDDIFNVNAVLNSNSINDDLLPAQLQQNLGDMQIDFHQSTPLIGGHTDNGESSRKRRRSGLNLIYGDKNSSKVLQDLNGGNANSVNRRTPKAVFAVRRTAWIVPQANRKLIFDEVTQIPTDSFCAQLRPTRLKVATDFPFIADGQYPTFDKLLNVPSRPIAANPLCSLYQRILAAGTARGVEKIVESDRVAIPAEPAAAGQSNQADNNASPPPIDNDVFFAQSTPPLPTSPVLGEKFPAGNQTATILEDDMNWQENYSDYLEITIDAPRRQAFSADEHTEPEKAIDFQDTLSLSPISSVEGRVPFKRFVSKTKGRHAAAMMFKNLMDKHDQGKVFFEQEPSYSTFNTVFVIRRPDVK